MPHEDPRRPSQTVPTLKVAVGLKDDHTYAGVWTGQSNSLPWGLPADAFDPDFGLELANVATGADLAQITVPANPFREVGTIEQLIVPSVDVGGSIWNTSTQLRFGSNVAPLRGYADVLVSDTVLLKVRWRSLPDLGVVGVTFDSNTDRVTWPGHTFTAGQQVAFKSTGSLPSDLAAGVVYSVLNPIADEFELEIPLGNGTINLTNTGTGVHTGFQQLDIPGYLVRENGMFSAYDFTRVLTPFMPWLDWRPAVAGELPMLGPGTPDEWQSVFHAPYPVPDATSGRYRQRLILPPPYAVPAGVTVFDDLALFLPMTRREGQDGYGFSEVSDSTFAGTGWTGHPLTAVVSTGSEYDFAIGNPFTAEADLTNAYFLIDWEDAASNPKRSWGRVLTTANASLGFGVEKSSWIGDPYDAAIEALASLLVLWDLATNEVLWTAHGLKDGDLMFLESGTAPTGLTLGRTYFVANAAADPDRFQLTEHPDLPPADLGGIPTDVILQQTWSYTVWVPHWKDSPHAWIPGPEFAYPNEDSQLRNTYIHFRARGRYLWSYNNKPEPGSGLALAEPFDGVSDSRFGAMLPFAWRTGSALGKIVYMVGLGIGSTPLAPTSAVNAAAGVFTGSVGWWDYEKLGYAIAMENTDSFLSQRLRRLVEFMAPQALLAEGIAEPLRFLFHGHIQGEADGFTVGGRESYRALIAGFRDWMRDIITDGGMSPFQSKAKMPFVQPLITAIPYENDPNLSWSDRKGEINDAIREVHTDEEFSDYTLSDDLPKINGGHYSGGGMVVLGARLAAIALDVLEYALAHGSTSLRTATNERLLDIANTALTTLGQGAQVVTDLSADTTEARLLSRYLPKATEQLMGMRTWSWATRIESAAIYEHHRDPRYKFGFVVPGRAARVTKVSPFRDPGAEGVYVSVIAPIMQNEILDRGPYRFEIQRSLSGSRILFTDVPQVEGAIESQIPIPSNELFGDRLPKRPLITYIDKQVNPDRYSPSFAQALTYMLAGFMAPALVRGEAGMKVQKDMFAAAAGWVAQEGEQEGANQHQPLVHQPDWLQARQE